MKLPRKRHKSTAVREVPLRKKGRFAIVDKEDYKRCMEHSWYLNDHGYASKGDTVLGRFILGIEPTDRLVKYKNGNKLDCRKSNLVVDPLYRIQQAENKRASRVLKGMLIYFEQTLKGNK